MYPQFGDGIQGLSAAGWTALRIGCSLLEIVLQSLRPASGSCSCGIHAVYEQLRSIYHVLIISTSFNISDWRLAL